VRHFLGILLGLGGGFLVWFIAVKIFVPEGSDFTGYAEGMLMLALLPVFLFIGAGVGSVVTQRSTSKPLPPDEPE
jgi:drug/metabolite transporter (DMT)-like permease